MVSLCNLMQHTIVNQPALMQHTGNDNRPIEMCVCVLLSYSRENGKLLHFAVRVISPQPTESQFAGSKKRVESVSWSPCFGLRSTCSRQSPVSESTVAMLFQNTNHHHQNQSDDGKDGRKQSIMIRRSHHPFRARFGGGVSVVCLVSHSQLSCSVLRER